jgi:hypothetical protein
MTPKRPNTATMTMITVEALPFFEGIITMPPKSFNSLVAKCPRVLQI